MKNQVISKLWRLTGYLLIPLLLIGTVSSMPSLASPALQSQDPETEVADSSVEPQLPTLTGDNLVTNVSLTQGSPNIMLHNVDVTLNFSYNTTEEAGVRIFILPFTDGNPTLNFAVSGSPIYPLSANGSGSATFTITAGDVVVDQVRIKMTSVDQSVILFETFIPVHYLFTSSLNVVNNIRLSPDTPDVLGFGQHLNIIFNYQQVTQEGVTIFIRPFTNGALTPNYEAPGSPIYYSSVGRGSGYITIHKDQVVVDQIRIQMFNADQSVLLFEAFLPVYVRFRDAANIVTDIEFTPDTPNIFKYGDPVNLTFNYSTDHKEGVQIFARPFSGATLSRNYGAHGSDIYPQGSGSGTGWFTLNSGPTVVDKVRIRMVASDDGEILFEAYLPVHLFWAGAGPDPGPDMGISAIEVTQAVQDLNNSVDLVAGKRTYVRVHASSPVTTSDVFATLTGKRGFVSLTPVLNPGNPGSDITLVSSPDRGQINDSFWFELPSSWTTAGSLTLTAKLDPNNAKNDLNQVNNTKTVTVNFNTSPPLRLKLVNVQYTSGGTTYLAANSHLTALESWLRRAYPIPELQVTRQTLVYPDSGLPNVNTLHSYLALIKVLRIIFSGEDGRIVYYGIVDDGGGFMRGKAAGIPSTIAAGPTGSDTWGWDTDGSYGDWYGGHEIGHTRGRYHAMFCGAGGGVAYPYPNGRISPELTGNTALYGFDITTRAIYGPNWKDLMTYCDYEWMSDFTYEGIRSHLVSVGSIDEMVIASITASDFLAVVGMADLESNNASLSQIYLISQENTIPLPEPGDWTIVLLDGSNNDLATYPFQPDELTDNEDLPGRPAVIAEVVPFVPGTERIEIRFDGEVVASRDASDAPPSVELQTPANDSTLTEGPFDVTWVGSDPDGDTLSYSLLYSNDGGSTWDAIASGLTGSSIELHTDLLPGGSGSLRVVATDGFLTGQDTNSPINVPLHAPQAQISLPAQNQVFYPTQTIQMLGSAYDLEDGVLSGEALIWSSSVDGVLGSGESLNIAELTTGHHLLTLSVTDSNGMTTQVQREIEIVEEGTPEALNLQLSPLGIGEVSDLNAGPIQQTLSVRSSGDTELTWTASENLPWLSLSSTSGNTPADVVLTINPSGLPAGRQTGVITFQSDTAENSPVAVTVTLYINGRSVYLPALIK